jgi:hypothetical protein
MQGRENTCTYRFSGPCSLSEKVENCRRIPCSADVSHDGHLSRPVCRLSSELRRRCPLTALIMIERIGEIWSSGKFKRINVGDVSEKHEGLQARVGGAVTRQRIVNTITSAHGQSMQATSAPTDICSPHALCSSSRVCMHAKRQSARSWRGCADESAARSISLAEHPRTQHAPSRHGTALRNTQGTQRRGTQRRGRRLYELVQRKLPVLHRGTWYQ